MLRYVRAFALNWADAKYGIHSIIHLRLRPPSRLQISQHLRAELQLLCALIALSVELRLTVGYA